MDEFAARFIAYKGDDEYVPATSILVEITEIVDGNVELAFNAPIPGSPRIYLSVPLTDVVARSMKNNKS